MKSDQVASRNWRRGQCQSLSRSRSWQRSLQRSRFAGVICALALAFNLFALCATATIPSCPLTPPTPPQQGTLAPQSCRQLGLALGLNCATVHRYRWAYLHNYRFIPSRPPFSILHSTAFPNPPYCCIPCPLASAPDSDLDSPFDVDRKLATAALFSNENYCIYY